MKFMTAKAFLLLSCGVLFLVFLSDKRPGKHFTTYLVFFLLLLVYNKYVVPIIEEKLCLEKIKGLIVEHETALSIQRSRLITKDIYGNIHDEPWKKEIEKFLDRTIIRKHLNPREKDILEYKKPYNMIVAFVDKVAKEKQQYYIETIDYSDALSGQEYELLCKNILLRAGWNVEITKTVGDQGVDLIATKNNKVVAIQCKKYSSSIGNGAVQEIIAGKTFYKAHHGVVVSNAAYTKSAKELAEVNKIRLLHHNDLIQEDFFTHKVD